MEANLRESDTLVAHSMHRLARNIANLRHIVKTRAAKAEAVKFVKVNLAFE